MTIKNPVKRELKDHKGHAYMDIGTGTPLILLHGLMGGLSNFDSLIDYFSERQYRLIVPQLPIFESTLEKTNVESIANYFMDFFKTIVNQPSIILGNSLGGHVALISAIELESMVKGIILTGSSGLYEKGFGETFPKRGNYEYVQKKTEEVFYNPLIATKEVVDDVFGIVNNNDKALRLLHIARSAINHNMKESLPHIHQPVCLIWGKQDNVTPPEVAEEFNAGFPNATLYWIDQCGHAPMMEHPSLFNELLEKWLLSQQLI